MQLANFPLNLPVPLMQALGDLEGLQTGLQGLSPGSGEGEFWMRLAVHLQSLDEVARALPEDVDAEALAAWLAASMGGDELPQGGEDLPSVLPGDLRIPGPELAAQGVVPWRTQPGTDGGTDVRSGALSLRDQWLALMGHRMSSDAEPVPGQKAPDLRNAAAMLAELSGSVRHETPLVSVSPMAVEGGASSGSGPGLPQTSVSPRMFQLDVPLHQPGWDRSLGERVRWMASEKVQVAELRLNPPSLGPLEVRVHVEGDRTHINFLAPQAAVREAIDAALPRLRELFAEGGLNLGDVTVSHQDARHAGGEGNHGPGRSGPDADAVADAETGSVAAAQGPRQGLGLVDYYA